MSESGSLQILCRGVCRNREFLDMAWNTSHQRVSLQPTELQERFNGLVMDAFKSRFLRCWQ